MAEQGEIDFSVPASSGEDLRDENLQLVSRNPFMADSWEVLQRIPAGYYTGEDIRHIIEAQDIRPHHNNAWGALIRKAVIHNLLIETGRWLKMKDVKQHAHRSPEYFKHPCS